MFRTNKGCFLALGFFLLVIDSCKPSISNQKELYEFIHNDTNGLLQKKEVGGILIQMLYKPEQLLASENFFKNKANKKAGNYHFVLSISSNNKELFKQLPFNKYSEIVQVFAFRMNDFIKIIKDDHKIIDVSGCYYLPTYGASHSNQLFFVFDKNKLTDSRNLRLVIKEFGLNIGDLYFDFDNSQLAEIANLKID